MLFNILRYLRIGNKFKNLVCLLIKLHVHLEAHSDWSLHLANNGRRENNRTNLSADSYQRSNTRYTNAEFNNKLRFSMYDKKIHGSLKIVAAKI